MKIHIIKGSLKTGCAYATSRQSGLMDDFSTVYHKINTPNFMYVSHNNF